MQKIMEIDYACCNNLQKIMEIELDFFYIICCQFDACVDMFKEMEDLWIIWVLNVSIGTYVTKLLFTGRFQ